MLQEALVLTLTLYGHSISMFEEIAFIIALGALFVMLATIFFSRSD